MELQWTYKYNCIKMIGFPNKQSRQPNDRKITKEVFPWCPEKRQTKGYEWISQFDCVTVTCIT